MLLALRRSSPSCSKPHARRAGRVGHRPGINPAAGGAPALTPKPPGEPSLGGALLDAARSPSVKVLARQPRRRWGLEAVPAQEDGRCSSRPVPSGRARTRCELYAGSYPRPRRRVPRASLRPASATASEARSGGRWPKSVRAAACDPSFADRQCGSSSSRRCSPAVPLRHYGLRGYRFALLEAGHVVQNAVPRPLPSGCPHSRSEASTTAGSKRSSAPTAWTKRACTPCCSEAVGEPCCRAVDAHRAGQPPPSPWPPLARPRPRRGSTGRPQRQSAAVRESRSSSASPEPTEPPVPRPR
jgi:hypothetical protein